MTKLAQIVYFCKPLPVSLKAFYFEPLNGHNQTTSWFSRSQCVCINPSFENTTKTSFSKKCV
uniref:Uncharacterized protein n=1 Tax=Rhizophora mucronata TaxID=61149 RepID=A0A2P2N283_RHIMU